VKPPQLVYRPAFVLVDGAAPAHPEGFVGVDLDRLIASRLLVQANSGGGKSWAVRQLLEETYSQLQHLVIDPEGEFSTLREKFGYVLAAPKDGDVVATPATAKLLCRRLLELNASAVIDIYELSVKERSEFVRRFLAELIALPRNLWRPLLVVIDEAHTFAPEAGKGESVATSAVIDLVTKGRKRGFCAVLATQRIAKLNKDAAADLNNKLVGFTSFDIDVKRAGDDLGFDKDGRQALKQLKPGEFFAYGPAISPVVTRVRTADRLQTTHPEMATIGGAASTALIPTPAAVAALVAQLGDLPKEAEAEARSIEELQARVRQLEKELRAKPVTGPDPGEVAAWRDRATTAEAALGAERNRVSGTVARDAHTIKRLRQTIEDLMKFVVQINAENFTTKVGDLVDAEAMKNAIEGAVAQAAKLIEANLDSRNRRLEALQREGAQLLNRLTEALEEDVVNVAVSVTHNEPFSVRGGWRAARGAAPAVTSELPETAIRRGRGEYGNGNGGAPTTIDKTVQGAHGKILGALALLETLGMTPVTKLVCAVYAGYSIGGTFANYLGALNSRGLICYPRAGYVALTDAGRDAAPSAPAFRSLADLHALAIERAGGASGRILERLLQRYPESISKPGLAAATNYSIGGTFANYLGRLRTLGFVTYPDRGLIRASDVLFPPGLD
jgi:hypothetical protein